MLLSSCGHPHGAAEIGWGPLKNLGDLYKSPIFRERHWAIGSELGH
jgi:hypothetical protein